MCIRLCRSLFSLCTVIYDRQVLFVDRSYFSLCFIFQIMSEMLPDLADLLPPSSDHVSFGVNTSVDDNELLKLFM